MKWNSQLLISTKEEFWLLLKEEGLTEEFIQVLWDHPQCIVRTGGSMDAAKLIYAVRRAVNEALGLN
jgi:hypothetical protein